MKLITRAFNITCGLVIFVLLIISKDLRCQGIKEKSIGLPFVNVSYSFQVPTGDLTDWYGVNSTIGGGVSYKTKNNYIMTLDWGFIFGGDVKNEDMLFKQLYASSGYIINRSGQEAIITLYERGHSILFRFGKLFAVNSLNPNSGYYVTGGLGVLMHKIQIDVFDDDVPGLSEEYRKGYDRLSIGPSAGFQFGFLWFGNKNMMNFHGAFEAVYGLTQNVRPYNFDQMQPDKAWKNDLYIGLKVGWILPIYPKKPKDYYYY